MPVKPGKAMYAWTKKIGPQHGSKPGEAVTLCGLSMLGNNYSKAGAAWPDPNTDAPVCKKCKSAIEGETNGS